MLDKNKMQQNLVLDRMHIFHCICHHFILCNCIFCIFRIWFNIFPSLLLLLKWGGVIWPQTSNGSTFTGFLSRYVPPDCATRVNLFLNETNPSRTLRMISENELWEWLLRMSSENEVWEWSLTKVDGNVGKRWRRWGKEAEEKAKWESFSRRPVWGLRLHPPPHLTANLTDFQIHYMLSGIIFGSF